MTGNPRAKPVFVIGLARSGTNLIARMLDRHPAVALALDPLMPVFRSLRNAVTIAGLPPEARPGFRPEQPFQDHYFARGGPALLDALLDGDAKLPVAAGELDRLRRAVVDRTALESPDLARRMATLDGTDYRALLASALSIVHRERPDATVVAVKEVWLFDFVPLLARAFPDARFYAIERDPRGIVASLLAMAERDPTQAAHPPSYLRHWRKSIALSRRYEADADLSRRFRTVGYESLVSDPEAEARRICRELDLPFVDAMLDLSAEGWTGNSSFDDAGRDVYGSSTDRWRTSLAPEIVRTADALCGPEMTLTGYRPESDGTLDGVVLEYLARVGEKPGSWRSDSGDLLVDAGGELLRHRLLGLADVDPELTRRCFLFRETYEAVRQQGAWGDTKA